MCCDSAALYVGGITLSNQDRREDAQLPAVFIGIDLAWSRRNPSGGAVIVDGRLVDWRGNLGDDGELIAYVGQWVGPSDAAVVAVDAPLRVPNLSGARACDRAVTAAWGRYHAGAHPANRGLLARDGDVRGETLVRLLADALGFGESAPIVAGSGVRAVCEVYPHVAHVSLFGLAERFRYKAKPGWDHATRWTAFAQYQAALAGLATADPPLRASEALTALDVVGRRGRALKRVEDGLDALTCAYVAAYAWRHGPPGQIVYGDVASGHILAPRRLDAGAS